MGKDTKIVHFQIIDGSQEDFKRLGFALNEMKKKIDMDIEFLITDEKIELSSVKYLLKHLYDLYKKTKKLKEVKKDE